MKLKLLTLMCLMLIAAGSFAKSGKKAEANARMDMDIVAYKIKQKIAYPDFAREQRNTGTVLVEFKCDEKGNIHVLNTNQSDKKLRDYVVTEMEKINLGMKYASDAIYQLKVNFRLI
jgi:hypothetical protein